MNQKQSTEKNCPSKDAKLRIQIANNFLLGNRYTKAYIKTKLQELYALLDMRSPDGKPKNAKASHLQDCHMFLLNDCKIEVKGRMKNGFEIVKLMYTIK